MANHSKDGDCTVDTQTGCCVECGVDHSDPCPECNGHGFHKPECSGYNGEPLERMRAA